MKLLLPFLLGSRQTGTASATVAGDNHTPDLAVITNGGRAMSTDERDGLQALGFDVGSSNPRLEEGDLRCALCCYAMRSSCFGCRYTVPTVQCA